MTLVEPVGRLETWRTNSVSEVDETPLVSDPSPSTRFGLADATPVFTATGMRLALSAVEGSVWVPWAFTPTQALENPVSSVGLGAIASGSVIARGTSLITTTHVLPAWGVFALINPGQLAAATTPLWDETSELRIITPGLNPRVLRLRDMLDLFVSDEPAAPHTQEALSAVSDLMRWLSRSRQEIASLCDFSLRASRYWNTGMTPRPSTVRHLLDVHAFVASLVRAVGTPQARAWLEQPGANGSRHFEALATSDGVTGLLREANSMLFAAPPRVDAPMPETLTAALENEFAAAYEPAASRSAPRRVRRPPARGV